MPALSMEDTKADLAASLAYLSQPVEWRQPWSLAEAARLTLNEIGPVGWPHADEALSATMEALSVVEAVIRRALHAEALTGRQSDLIADMGRRLEESEARVRQLEAHLHGIRMALL